MAIKYTEKLVNNANNIKSGHKSFNIRNDSFPLFNGKQNICPGGTLLYTAPANDTGIQGTKGGIIGNLL